ncbi:WD40-repeat-containing domain protein [Cladochytrium replicatum]|nr:WD40-repeat-containing domain protein [Cladochytrium replicatum]
MNNVSPTLNFHLLYFCFDSFLLQAPQYIAIAGYKRTDEHHGTSQRQTREASNDSDDEEDQDEDQEDLGRAADATTSSSFTFSGSTFGGTEDLVSCIQIWEISPTMLNGSDPSEQPRLSLCILHDWGATFDMQWMPYGGYESIEEYQTSQLPDQLPSLGLLALITGDGHLRILNVPHPAALYDLAAQYPQMDLEKPLCARYTDVMLEASFPHLLPIRLSWSGHESVAVGASDGSMLTYRLNDAVENFNVHMDTKAGALEAGVEYPPLHPIEPAQFFFGHDSCVRGLCSNNPWNRISFPTYKATQASELPPSTLLASCGNDGKLIMWDGGIKTVLFRTRGLLHTMCWSSSNDLICFSDGEHIVRIASTREDLKIRTIASSIKGFSTKSICGHQGGVWGIDCSRFFPFIASCGSDGAVRISNLNNRLVNHAKIYVNRLYALDWEVDQQTYVIRENLTEELSSQWSKGSTDGTIPPDPIAIHKVKWCPNIVAAGWIVSGGASGLVRLECTLPAS